MNDDSTNPSPSDSGSPRPPRRKRYGGTHPAKFGEKYKELQPEQYPEMQEHVRAQGRTPAGTHVPIMVREIMECLAPQPGEVVADGTLGYGGHAREFLSRIAPGGRLVGFDLDREQLDRTGRRLEKEFPGAMAARGHDESEQGLAGENMAASGHGTSAKNSGLPAGVTLGLHHGNFAGIDRALAAEGIEGYDIIFADLGVSSMQIDDPARGFSYKHEGLLDMRMDPRRKRSAADLLATLPEEKLSAALAELADEPDHAAIARAVVERRSHQPIRTTTELVDLVLEAKGLSHDQWQKRAAQSPGELHPAALTFQALRILVNDELASLAQLLRVTPWCLQPGGRLGIISFHSGEDRLVKQSFREGLAAGVYAAIADEVLRPTAAEVYANPRSKPARFRWARKPASA
jgi:16S rRNA (cytosine1402-N4)-methyltransferase